MINLTNLEFRPTANNYYLFIIVIINVAQAGPSKKTIQSTQMSKQNSKIKILTKSK